MTVCRYVQRNALRAGLVEQAEAWPWGSLWHREQGATEIASQLAAWPVSQPENWLEQVNAPLTAAELESLRHCVNKGRPSGDESWVDTTARALNISLKKQGRPKKKQENGS